MLSIIICSRDKSLINYNNIRKTIGCSYELIVIDNSSNNYSIFEAYNKGIKKSNGEIICFVHEDVLFHTKNWGVKLINFFEVNQNLGLLGVAGTTILTKIPCGWWDCREKYKRINIIQHSKFRNVEKFKKGFENGSIEEVVIIDGVFMVYRKSINVLFDINFKGFHGYDFNLSMEIQNKGFKVCTTNEILLEHYSIGTLNKKWLQNIFLIYKKYRHNLPISIDKNIDIKEATIYSCEKLLYHCMKIGGLYNMFKYWIYLCILHPTSKMHRIIFKHLIRRIKK